MAGAGDLELDIAVEGEAWSAAVPALEDRCRRAAQAAFRSVWREPAAAEVAVLLSDDAHVRQLNRSYRGRDVATNVLAFAARDAAATGAMKPSAATAGAPPVLLGDIVIAFETTATEAAADDKSVGDHLSHLIVHGMLHLLGYDHQSEAEAVVMEELETRILAALGIPDPYAAADSDR
jgi:probable rRNA maturation factor